MQKAKILFINSAKDCREISGSSWLLEEGKVYTLGRRGNSTAGVDIDLSFDPSVSRDHADIWFEGKTWKIRDKSTYGTRLNNETIPANKTAELKFDDEISIGNKTALDFIPATREHFFLKDAWLEVELSDALNCALIFNGLPFLQKIIIRNCANITFPPNKLRLTLGNLLDAVLDIPPIEPGKNFVFHPDLKIAPELLEGQTEAYSAPLKVFINDSFIGGKEIRILAFNTWSKEDTDYHRTSLAAFVLPNHPDIERAATEIRKALVLSTPFEQAAAGETLRAIYNYFSGSWQIGYINEQAAFEASCQKIRLPHQLLPDWQGRKGSGTCLDLALLFAACLENLEEEPLVFIFEVTPGLCHALVGCRRKKCVVLNPLIGEIKGLEEEVFILDPTGIGQGLGFDEALAGAAKILKEAKFIFALDITTARRYKILPLPFSGKPKESSVIIAVDKLSRELAEEIGRETGYRVYSTAHLLLALFLSGEGITREIFKRLGFGAETAKTVLGDWLKGLKPEKKMEAIRPSEHYASVFSLAAHKAKTENAPLVMERHLFLALLEVESQAFDRVISHLGTSRQALKQAALELLEIKPVCIVNKSFLGSG